MNYNLIQVLLKNFKGNIKFYESYNKWFGKIYGAVNILGAKKPVEVLFDLDYEKWIYDNTDSIEEKIEKYEKVQRAIEKTLSNIYVGTEDASDYLEKKILYSEMINDNDAFLSRVKRKVPKIIMTSEVLPVVVKLNAKSSYQSDPDDKLLANDLLTFNTSQILSGRTVAYHEMFHGITHMFYRRAEEALGKTYFSFFLESVGEVKSYGNDSSKYSDHEIDYGSSAFIPGDEKSYRRKIRKAYNFMIKTQRYISDSYHEVSEETEVSNEDLSKMLKLLEEKFSFFFSKEACFHMISADHQINAIRVINDTIFDLEEDISESNIYNILSSPYSAIRNNTKYISEYLRIFFATPDDKSKLKEASKKINNFSRFVSNEKSMSLSEGTRTALNKVKVFLKKSNLEEEHRYLSLIMKRSGFSSDAADPVLKSSLGIEILGDKLKDMIKNDFSEEISLSDLNSMFDFYRDSKFKDAIFVYSKGAIPQVGLEKFDLSSENNDHESLNYNPFNIKKRPVIVP